MLFNRLPVGDEFSKNCYVRLTTHASSSFQLLQSFPCSLHTFTINIMCMGPLSESSFAGMPLGVCSALELLANFLNVLNRPPN